MPAIIAERFRGPYHVTTTNSHTWAKFISNVRVQLENLTLHPDGSLNRRGGTLFAKKTSEILFFSRYLFRTPSNHSKNLKNGISGENARS